MKWYKHDSNANNDAKLMKVRLKYGMEGYGLYWYCLEQIASVVEAHNLTFELEHDAEIISASTSIHVDRVQEMIAYMVDLGLFENHGGRITCMKLALRADEYTAKILRQIGGVPLLNSGQTPDSVPIVSGQTPDSVRTMSDKVPPIRTEQNRTEQKIKPSTKTARSRSKNTAKRFQEFWDVYPKKRGRTPCEKKWKSKQLDQHADLLIADVSARVKHDRQWIDGYAPNPLTYLNQERWTDEMTGGTTGKKLSYAEQCAAHVRGEL